jgi:RNA polymerase sigma-70 factor (ECF subfamily)
VPESPLAWLTTVARNRARDRLRRRTTERAKLALASSGALEQVPPVDDAEIPDERLRLIFTCCHPALPMAGRVALTLRTLGGLTPAEIARAFLVTEPAMEKRLVRARAKIKNAGIPYRVPPPELWAERVDGVLSVLYLMFNEGYAASSGDALLRVDVSAEAIRLARSLAELLPSEPEVRGLLALLLLTDARRPARVCAGRVVPLGEQDRSLWDADLVAEGARLLDAEPPWGPYAVQARIALCHDLARRPEDTDWATIAELYTHLPATPVVELNRAVAVAMAYGPATALPLVEALADDLDGYYLHAATRADLYARLGRRDDAVAALTTAIAQAPTGAERRLLRDRRDTLLADPA